MATTELSRYVPFEGDGRKRISCQSIHLQHMFPSPISYSQARMLIDRFLQRGESNHSALGETLWVLIEWCQYHKEPYTLTAYPGFGYQIKRAKPLELS
jgi:hypothetical protein